MWRTVWPRGGKMFSSPVLSAHGLLLLYSDRPVSVSYTHLDVYKRQYRYIPFRLRRPCVKEARQLLEANTVHVPVSYTHL